MLNIAIVDDEVTALQLFELHLRKEVNEGKINLKTFDNPENLINYLESDSEDIIFLLSDINMPQMNGFQLLTVIKEKFPDIKVYMESAYDSKEYIDKAYDLGADGYLTKPIDFTKVRELIEEHM